MLATWLPSIRSCTKFVPAGQEPFKVTAPLFEGELGDRLSIVVEPDTEVPTVKFPEPLPEFAFAAGSDISEADTLIV